jgi:hypothetical protein
MPASDDLLFLFPRTMRRRRCDARNQCLFKMSRARTATISRDPFCKARALNGSCRCRMHGGLSTGPRTPEGRARSIAAMVEGRRRWLARMKAEGKKLTCGRKSGEAWVTTAMKERELERQRAELARLKLERWATLSPQQRLAEQHREITSRAVEVLDEMLERFKTTDSLF